MTANLVNRGYSTVTFKLDNCITNYIFIGPDNIPIVYNDQVNSLTTSIQHTDVSKNKTGEARLYLAARPITYGRFSLNRKEVASQGSGLVWAWITGDYFLFNTFVYESYERLSIGWYAGTLNKVWVGQSVAELKGNQGGEFPRDFDAWLVNHNYLNQNFVSVFDKPMTTGPILGGNPLYGNSSNSFTFGYGQVRSGQAAAKKIQLGGAWSLFIGNNPVATAAISN
jgi:hypothetical protein